MEAEEHAVLEQAEGDRSQRRLGRLAAGADGLAREDPAAKHREVDREGERQGEGDREGLARADDLVETRRQAENQAEAER